MEQVIKEVFSQAWVRFAAFVAGCGVVYKMIGYATKTWRWLKAQKAARDERNMLPQKTHELIEKLQAQVEAKDLEIQTQLEEMSAKLVANEASNRQMAAQMTQVIHRLETVEGKLDLNDQATATLQSEKLNWAYYNYGIRRNKISLQTKVSLQLMKQLYTQRGHNHLPEDWDDRINNAPMIDE